MGRLDLFIGGRVHSLISATSMHVPSLALISVSDSRANEILDYALNHDKWICYIEELDFGRLLAKMVALLSTYDEVRRNLESRVEVMKKRALLNGKLLRILLNSR